MTGQSMMVIVWMPCILLYSWWKKGIIPVDNSFVALYSGHTRYNEGLRYWDYQNDMYLG